MEGLLSAYKGLKRKVRREGVVMLSSLLSAYKGLKQEDLCGFQVITEQFIKCL